MLPSQGQGPDVQVPGDDRPTLLCASHFGPEDMLRLKGSRLAQRADAPIPSLFWAAGFSFSRSQLLTEACRMTDPFPLGLIGPLYAICHDLWTALHSLVHRQKLKLQPFYSCPTNSCANAPVGIGLVTASHTHYIVYFQCCISRSKHGPCPIRHARQGWECLHWDLKDIQLSRYADIQSLQVPYQDLPFLFFGEEQAMLARMWTHGYDMYAPPRSIAWHRWSRSHRHTFHSCVPQVDHSLPAIF